MVHDSQREEGLQLIYFHLANMGKVLSPKRIAIIGAIMVVVPIMMFIRFARYKSWFCLF